MTVPLCALFFFLDLEKKTSKKIKATTTGERATLRCPCCRTTVSRNAWHAGDRFCGLGIGGGTLLWEPAEAALEKVWDYFFFFAFSKGHFFFLLAFSPPLFSSFFFLPLSPFFLFRRRQEDTPMESRIKLDTALDLKGNYLFGTR